MKAPKKDDYVNWSELLGVSKVHMNLSIDEFWRLTFAEFWSVHESKVGKKQKSMNKSDLEDLEKKWGASGGNFRRVSSKAGSRDARSAG